MIDAKAVAHIEELAGKATPGPWEIWADDDDVIGQVVCQLWPKSWKVMRSNAVKPFADTPDPADNGDFIAASREAIPDLVSTLREAVELLGRWDEQGKRWPTSAPLNCDTKAFLTIYRSES